MTGGEEARRLAERVAALLSRPGAWLGAAGDGYAVRLDDDGRRRPALRVSETVFAELTRRPGLAVRPAGGWRLPREVVVCSPDRPIAERAPRPTPASGGSAGRGESALAWLARRTGPDGAPWLTPAELAAGERLQSDFERSGVLGRLTMAWDAGPRSRGGRGPGVDPLEHGRAARARVAAAMEDVGPELRRPLEQVCLRGLGLAEMERALRLRRRTGKLVLKRALGELARHYRLG